MTCYINKPRHIYNNARTRGGRVYLHNIIKVCKSHIMVRRVCHGPIIHDD